MAQVQPFLHAAQVYVAPLRMGSGTRLKILEAMAAGCAVVATSAAVSGLDADARAALIIADSETDFADGVVRLLQDADQRAKQGQQAQKIVRTLYDWSALIPHLLDIYREIVVRTWQWIEKHSSGATAAWRKPFTPYHSSISCGVRRCKQSPRSRCRGSIIRNRNERILLLRPDHLGDVLLTTPAIRALRAAHPDSEIHALVGSWSANVLANFSDLDVVLTLPYPGFTRLKKAGWRSPYQLAATSARILRLIGYNTAIILRPDHWWGALLAYLAGIPRRIGYDLPDVAPFLTE